MYHRSGNKALDPTTPFPAHRLHQELSNPTRSWDLGFGGHPWNHSTVLQVVGVPMPGEPEAPMLRDWVHEGEAVLGNHRHHKKHLGSACAILRAEDTRRPRTVHSLQNKKQRHLTRDKPSSFSPPDLWVALDTQLLALGLATAVAIHLRHQHKVVVRELLWWSGGADPPLPQPLPTIAQERKGRDPLQAAKS